VFRGLTGEVAGLTDGQAAERSSGKACSPRCAVSDPLISYPSSGVGVIGICTNPDTVVCVTSPI
jgi:hypothetical protein